MILATVEAPTVTPFIRDRGKGISKEIHKITQAQSLDPLRPSGV